MGFFELFFWGTFSVSALYTARAGRVCLRRPAFTVILSPAPVIQSPATVILNRASVTLSGVEELTGVATPAAAARAQVCSPLSTFRLRSG